MSPFSQRSPALGPTLFWFRAASIMQEVLMLIHHTSQHPSPTSQCKLHSRAPAASLQPAACKPGIVGNFKGVPSIPAAMAVCFSAVSSSKPRHSQLQGRPVPPGGPTAMLGRPLRDEGRKGNGAENAAQTVPHSSLPVPQTPLTGCAGATEGGGRLCSQQQEEGRALCRPLGRGAVYGEPS